MSRINALRKELGGAHELAVNKVKDHLDKYVRAYVENAPFAVLSSSDSGGNCDASPKGGTPGFIKVIDDRTLLIPDIGGNRLFQSFQNFESNPKAALLLMIPGMDTTARINGRVRVVEASELHDMDIKPELANPDNNSNLVQGIWLDIDEAYLHCPRAFRFSTLWDIAAIEENAKRSLKSLL